MHEILVSLALIGYSCVATDFNPVGCITCVLLMMVHLLLSCLKHCVLYDIVFCIVFHRMVFLYVVKCCITYCNIALVFMKAQDSVLRSFAIQFSLI